MNILSFNRFENSNLRLQDLVESFGPDALAQAPPTSKLEEFEENIDQGSGNDENDEADHENNINKKKTEKAQQEVDESEYWNDNRVLAWKPTIHATDEQLMRMEFKRYGRPRYIHSAAEVGLVQHLPEDEGLFVAPKLFIPEENWKKFESRLLREDPQAEIFFDEDKNVIIERSPLLPGCHRPAPQDTEAVAPTLRLGIEVPSKYTGNDEFYDLKIKINHLVLNDHPLFTEEDVWCCQLQEMHNEWMRRKTIDLLQYYADQIVALNDLVKSIERSIQHLSHDDPAILRPARKLKIALSKLLDCRKQRDNEEYEQLVLFKKLYRTWEKVKEWRRAKTAILQDEENKRHAAKTEINPGKNSTEPDLQELYLGFPLVLKVKQTLTKNAREQREWEELIDKEVAERKRMFEVDYILLPDKQLADEKDFNEALVRTQVNKRAENKRRRPGKPKYEPFIDKSVPITPDHQCDQKERTRRAELSNARITLILCVNNQHVLETEPVPLRFPAPFTASFNASVPLSLLSVPGSISFKVFTKQLGYNPFTKTQLAEFPIPIPEVGGTPAPQEYKFNGKVISTSKYIEDEKKNLSDKEGNVIPRYVEGTLEVAAYWDSDAMLQLITDNFEDFKTYWNRKVSRNNRAALMRRQRKEALAAQESEMDPNDPRNAVLIEIIRRQEQEARSAKNFRAFELHDRLMLVNPAQFMPSARRKVLEARNDSSYSSKQRVELVDSDIHDSLYDLIHVSSGVSREQKVLPSVEVLKRQMHGASVKVDVHDIKQVVREEVLPVFNLFSNDFWGELFRPRTRALNTIRKKTVVSAMPKSICIRLQVMRATNLPMRVDTGSGNDYVMDNVRNPASPGNIFVEIHFQQQQRTTKVRTGSRVEWNECFSLYISNGDQDLSPQHLQSIQDKIYFNVFDQLETVQDTSANKREHTLTRHWLGSFSIPFSTLYINSMVEGRLNIDVPFVLQGYRKPKPKQATSIHLFCALHPAVPPPFAKSGSPSDEQEKFFRYCLNWTNTLKAQFPYRNFQVLVDDVNQERQLCSNYIMPQHPPPGFEKPKAFTRWVSQIPFLDDMHLMNAGDVWCTDVNFLALANGDWEEHAILLCNYFRQYEQDFKDRESTGWRSYVLLGSAVPEGDTAYVLRLKRTLPPGVLNSQSSFADPKNRGKVTQVEIYDSCAGTKVDLINNPELTTLFSVGVVFDNLNVWANIQAVENPAELNWDLFDSKSWNPLFQLSVPISKYEEDLEYEPILKTIQKPLVYLPPDTKYFKRRAEDIERILKIQFERKRTRRTRWDYVACETYRKYLVMFESVKLGRSMKPDEGLLDKLNNAYGTRYGFPLSFSESDDPSFLLNSEDNPVVTAMFNTRMHENESENVSFALAVHIFPYVNKIGTIWVYMAALVPY